MQWMFEGLLHARLQYFAFVYALCLHVNHSQPLPAAVLPSHPCSNGNDARQLGQWRHY